MEKKYFFFDIDGTLTDRKTNSIVPSALDTLHKLKENGHFVAIATGRAHYKARKFLDEVGLEDMVCAGGGALVFHHELIKNTPLEIHACKTILNQVEQLGYGYVLQLDDSIKVYSKDKLFVQQCGGRKEPTEYIVQSDLDYRILDTIYKMYISIPAQEEYKLSTKNLLGHLRFVQEYLMFQYDEKHQGIVDMMEYVRGDLKDVVVFGDDTNDEVMFDPQWTSIAMGNATESLKEKADFVTKANIEDGIQYACKKFGWIE